MSAPLRATVFVLSSVVAVTACGVASKDAPELHPDIAPALKMEPAASKKTSRCKADSDCNSAAAGSCQVPYCDKQGAPRCLLRAAPDGTACSDGDPSTTDDVCQLGICTGTPTTPPRCGNGALDPGEVCDDGNQVDKVHCAYGVSSCTTCNSTCSAVLSLIGQYCGDGITNGAEGCDDGANSGTCGSCTTDCSAPATCP
jgi:cysteine-rich repeat protein